MTKNVGTVDRVLRTIAGLVLIAFAVSTGFTALGIVALVAGVVFLGTTLIGFCPLYTLFGIRTCPAKPAA